MLRDHGVLQVFMRTRTRRITILHRLCDVTIILIRSYALTGLQVRPRARYATIWQPATFGLR